MPIFLIFPFPFLLWRFDYLYVPSTLLTCVVACDSTVIHVIHVAHLMGVIISTPYQHATA